MLTRSQDNSNRQRRLLSQLSTAVAPERHRGDPPDPEEVIEWYFVQQSSMPEKDKAGVVPKRQGRRSKDQFPQRRQKRPSTSSPEQEIMMEVESALMKSINERLGKLDILVELQNDLRELKKSLEFSQAQIEDLRKENDSLKGTVLTIQKEMKIIQKESRQYKAALLDIQCRSMRENVIFSGLDETENDNPELVLRDFMCQKLKLPENTVHDIAFARVHRLGRRVPNKSRPIIARFEHFKQKEMVKSQGKLLKGTNIWMNDQLPSEINDRRK